MELAAVDYVAGNGMRIFRLLSLAREGRILLVLNRLGASLLTIAAVQTSQ